MSAEALLSRVESDAPDAEAALTQLRQGLAENPSASGFLAKAVLEAQARLRVRRGDAEGLGRALVELRPWGMAEEFAALELLLMLVQSRLGEFFQALEAVPGEVRDAGKHVGFVVSLERHLTEGAYNKVLHARANATSPMFGFLLEDLEHTVREEIASCAEVAYKKLSLAKGATLLNFDSPASFQKFAQARGWPIVQAQPMPYVDFTALPSQQQVVSSKTGLSIANFPGKWVVQESLNLASDLDRIV